MKNLKLRIITENKSFAVALERRIFQLYRGLEIIICESEQEVQEEFAGITLSEKDAVEKLPVRKLLTELTAEYEEKTGMMFFPGNNSPGIWCIRSVFGGSGCSAAALVLARILACGPEERVLLVSMGGRENEYVEKKSESLRPARELEYVLARGSQMKLEQYTVEDRYGPMVAHLKENTDKLLSMIREAKGFSHIIVDMGTWSEDINCHVLINIASVGDSRTSDFGSVAEEEIAAGSSELYLVNRAPCRQYDEQIFHIPDDSISFTRRDKDMAISMDGCFAAALRQVAEAGKLLEARV